MLATAANSADVPVYLDGVGTAKALNTVTVRPQIDGKLIAISFTEGQDVPKDYVLAKIDPVTYQAAYDQTVAKKAQDEAQLANARLDLERYTRLAATNAVNKQQLDTQKALVSQLEAQIKLDQAMIDNARAILSYTDVVAPIAGRTGIRQVDQGNIVKAADPTGIVILTQLRPISVFFSLPQQNLPDLTKGMAEGSASGRRLDAGRQERARQGQGDGDRQSGRSDHRHGEAQGGISQCQPAALARPVRQCAGADRHAAQRGGGADRRRPARAQRRLRLRAQGRQHRHRAAVSLTQQDDVRAVVASGLQAGERVVTTGFARLTEGTQVTVSSAEDAGQITPPGERPRPDGTRGTRGGEKAKRSSRASGPTAKNP